MPLWPNNNLSNVNDGYPGYNTAGFQNAAGFFPMTRMGQTQQPYQYNQNNQAINSNRRQYSQQHQSPAQYNQQNRQPVNMNRSAAPQWGFQNNQPPVNTSQPAPRPQNNAAQQNNSPYNQPLPDGVRLEPLDEKTLNLVRALKPDLQTIPAPVPDNRNAEPPITLPVPPPAAPSLPTAVPDLKPEPLAERLGDFIQNERNASIFYNTLSNTAPREHFRMILGELSMVSNKRSADYNKIYNKYKGNDFEIRNTEIMTGMGFRDGVELAIAEESKTLRELGELYDNIIDEKLIRQINGMMFAKLADLSLLHMINNNL